MDGDLGNYLRSVAHQIGFQVVHNCCDHGFREITTRTKPIETPADLKGFKIRLPVAPYLIALFQHLGASPTPINFGEVYSALQTGVVDGQENPLVLIDTAKLYEVQKYCSLTNHVWAGIHYSFGNQAWQRLPPDLQQLADKEFNAKALLERADWQVMTKNETKKLESKGMVFNSPDTKPFQDELRKSSFYADMKKKIRRQGVGIARAVCGRAVVTSEAPELGLGRRCRRSPALGRCAAPGAKGRFCDRHPRGSGRGRIGAGRNLYPLCRRRLALCLQQPADVDRRARQFSVLVAGDARRRRRLSPRQAHAADHLCRLAHSGMGPMAGDGGRARRHRLRPRNPGAGGTVSSRSSNRPS